jgi:hypothetical protein
VGIYVLFKDAGSISNCVASNGHMISVQYIGKDFKESAVV